MTNTNKERLNNLLKNAGFSENANYTWRYEIVRRGGRDLHRATFTFGGIVIQNEELKADRASAKEEAATFALPEVQSPRLLASPTMQNAQLPGRKFKTRIPAATPLVNL
ncbi:hypothetical protein FRC17_003640 [Serendipita sp. 399]|nr:hypothetical protein FRC17_003640 [Serendipita sp. 399]